jgi:LytS/YehU family sensor histidine kinase
MGASWDRQPEKTIAAVAVLAACLAGGAVFLFGGGFKDGAAWSAAALAVVLAAAIAWFARDRRRLRDELAQAELRRLRTQINPHFLYNALSAVSELCYTDAETADRLITRLSGLLRRALNQSDVHEIPLGEELDFVLDYIAIQRTLMRDRLKAEIDVDPRLLTLRIPGMIAQPLVENAVMHGLDASGCCDLTLRVRRAGGELLLEIADCGLGLRSRGPQRTGVGLANTRARLDRLYGPAGRLTIAEQPQGGVLARLVIPVQEPEAA